MGDVIHIEVVSAIQLPDVERMRNFGGVARDRARTTNS